VVERTKLPLVPLMLKVKVPVRVLPLALSVSVEVPASDTELGLKLALTREGNPLALKLTVPLNPFRAVSVTV